MRVRHKIWLEDESGLLFGQGRLELLKEVARLGSLSAAAKTLEMSYRAAWGRIRASEERLGLSLVERMPGGRGLRLTREGRDLVERFDRFEAKAGAAIERLSREILGGKVGPSSGPGESEPDR